MKSHNSTILRLISLADRTSECLTPISTNFKQFQRRASSTPFQKLPEAEDKKITGKQSDQRDGSRTLHGTSVSFLACLYFNLERFSSNHTCSLRIFLLTKLCNFDHGTGFHQATDIT